MIKLKFLKDFSHFNKWIGFLAAILLTIGLGVYDYAVIQGAEKKVDQIAEKEMPLLLAAKGLAAAGDAAEETLQGFLGNNGDDLYKIQWQQQAAITEYHMDAMKKLSADEELSTLLAKNKEWFVITEKEMMNAAESGVKDEESASRLAVSQTQIHDIQAGYQEQISVQKHVIQELEQEVMTAEKTSHLLIGIMSLIFAATCISLGFIFFRKILISKAIRVSNAA
jgi:CHASE3 domain sensor protein